ncbi:ATP-binding protein [Cocleimonas sp. KMM 6892]|uniref:sensor histidine kinase n=1 Tax=unclassified Cocleimonas TaxID=2639732 RepID=UPI002DBC777B|nr:MULTISPECIES: ATP-binding protein [unclassified Cocleimonas]MEB8433159.1 ATP-binding protein [Cocleimonas sp. KMM 6892]MEC4715860.1 ATP-binding protein [Cocleimonas sp. KMM 6895]MEC4745321.1 ATP-binding protein [Cocleimonas sp. KMM 6896]
MSVFRRILNTSVFRLSLVYAVLFSLIAAAALLSVYKVAETQIEEQIDRRLTLETNILLENYKKHAVKGLLEDINIYNKKEGRPFYIYALIHVSKLDLKKFIPVNQYTVTKRNKTFSSIPLSDIIDYVNDRQGDETIRVLLTLLPGGYQLLVGAELEETQHLLDQLFKATLIAISIIFGLSIIIGALMARKVVRGINAVTDTADNIIEGDLSHRIPVTTQNNEFDRLSLSLNSMLDRNEDLMQSMQQVTNNLAHDLRNPLNRIRHRLESARNKSMTDSEFTEFNEDTIGDIDNVISTFNSLLSIAQIESGNSRKNREQFELKTLLDDLSELYEVVASEKGLKWEYEAEDSLTVMGSKQLLAQLFTNLLDNAIKFSPENGLVSFKAVAIKSKQENKIEVTVSDNGPGIPAEEHEKVLKRFYRLDSARSTEGNGLGLSLVKAVTDLHGAEIHFKDNRPGLRVSVIFDSKQ